MILTPAEIAKYQRVTDSKCADCGLGCHDEGCIWTWITALLADREELEGQIAQAHRRVCEMEKRESDAGWNAYAFAWNLVREVITTLRAERDTALESDNRHCRAVEAAYKYQAELKSEIGVLRTRAEQAEAELKEKDAVYARLATRLMDEETRAEQAEAENKRLREALENIGTCQTNDCTGCTNEIVCRIRIARVALKREGE